jgi:hypothetical protein
MKRAAAIVALLSFFSVLASARDHPEFFSKDLHNGRFWRALNETQKIFYISGYREGISIGLRAANTKPETAQTYLPFNLPNGDIVKGVDKFYSKPENLRFPIKEALSIFSAKVNGASEELIDQAMDLLRKQYP